MGISPAICKYRNECDFYMKAKGTAAIMLLKKIYCGGASSSCEIFRRRVEGKPVPENLLPDGTVELVGVEDN